MKKVSLLFVIAALAFACQNEQGNHEESTPAPNIQSISQDANQSSSGQWKELLDRWVSETFYRMYGVEVDPEQTTLINKDALVDWIKQNETNLSCAINKENQRILSSLIQNGKVRALHIQDPASQAFNEAVYVIIPSEHRVADLQGIGAITILDHYWQSNEEEEDECDTKICSYQSGYDVIDTTDNSPMELDCSPCAVQSVDCDSDYAFQDDCLNC